MLPQLEVFFTLITELMQLRQDAGNTLSAQLGNNAACPRIDHTLCTAE